MSKNIIQLETREQLKKFGLPKIDLTKDPIKIKGDIIFYILKADKLTELHVAVNRLLKNYLLEQSVEKYLDINDVLFLLKNTTRSYYTDEIIEKYFSDEKSADIIINEYKSHGSLFKNAEAHTGTVYSLYLQYKEISAEEFIKRINVFYQKYQPIKLFGRIYAPTEESKYPRDIPKNINGMDDADVRRVYNGVWYLLKAIFTFYNDRPDCINDFLSKPIEHNYNSSRKWIRTELNYSLDNITDILIALRYTHDTFGMDGFILRTFKILDSSKNSNE